MSLSLDEYHAGHDCDPGQCVCKCGCAQMMGCRALTQLCSRCSHEAAWGDGEHDYPASLRTEGV